METENTLDLLTLFKILLKHIKLIIITTFIVSLTTFLISKFVVSPKYESKALLYVENKASSNDKLNSDDIMVAQTLTETCSVIFTSDKVMKKVANDPEIHYTAKELSEIVSVSTVNSTQVMEISVMCTDANTATYIVKVMEETCMSEYRNIIRSGNIAEVTPATFNKKPASPNLLLNSIIGALIGLVLVCTFILTKELLDTTIKSSDNLLERYNIPVFAEIASFELASSKR